MAWAQKAKLDARKIKTSPINIERLMTQITVFREMTSWSPDKFSPELQKILSECGVALVFVPHLKGSFLQGAVFVDGGKIVLGMTVRGNDGDRFWFSFFHELAHIILGHTGQMNGVSKEDDDAADQWSADQLIAPANYKSFIKKGKFSKDAIMKFAQSIGIAPGIVVGRLQKESFVRYDVLNDLKTHYIISD